MAHIKVIRRSMRPEEYIELRYGWLKRSVYGKMYELSPVYIRQAHQISENEYDYYDEDYSLLKNGDIYYTPDGSAFLHCECQLPEKLKDESDVYFYFKTASEMIVKINGQYAGGVDPNRDRILASPFIKGDKILIETEGFNRSKPDDERNPETLARRGCRQEFTGLYLTTVNENIQNLCYDLEIFTDIISSGQFPDEYVNLVISRLDKALNLIDYDNITEEDAKKAIDYIEENIYADKTYRSSGKVALIGHSHLDIAYYWRRIHAVQKNMRTVLIQMRLMDKYPDFRYAHTQAYTYETLEKYYPEVFEELKEKIKEGRFEIVGAMYVEPDCNVPSAESLIRQCLYGQHYFREKFGFTVDSCFLPDVFGNSWILPQILKKSGVNYFISNKMSTWNDTNRFPHNNFIWKGADGSEVYACVPPTHFITWNEPSQVIENWEAFQDKHTDTETLSMFGYGDGGSGATDEMIELMHRFEKLSVMPKTRHITCKEFLHENLNEEHKFDVWDGELYLEMHRGTFTTKSDIKRYNRKLENKFRLAELLSVARMNKGVAYPAEKIKELYKKFLVNQFHDILPGSHITPVFRDAMKDYIEVEAELNSIIGTGDILFNPLNIKRNAVEFIEDENGIFTREGKKGCYCITDFSPLSTGSVSAPDTDTSWIKTDGLFAETPKYFVKFNPDGSFSSLYDKELEREWVDGDFNKLKIYDDRPGNYDAWDILPDYKDKELPLSVSSELKFIKADGVTAEFSVTQKTEKSAWERKIRFFRNSRKIEVENIVDWHESHKLMKASFNCNILSRELTCDTSAGFIKREMHRNTTWQQARFECCHHKWFDISETDAGIAVINDCKYGVGVSEKEITLSLLRATERPDPLSDLGQHNFTFIILPHGNMSYAEINNQALFFNEPLVKTEKLSFPEEFIAKEKLILQSAKKAENGDMTVLRFCETKGARGTLKFKSNIKVLNLLEDIEYETDTVEYKPFEIITIGI
ncbi:MAG: alpha-mannosidase [Clostridia bacterium]|nr:alpha-mannosidase [Clostridia bacterium]